MEVRLCDDGSLDEVVGEGSFHLEKMSDKHWWMCIEKDHKRLDINLSSKARITATYQGDESVTPSFEEKLIERLTYALRNRGGLDVFPDLMKDAMAYLKRGSDGPT
jgi:hypothetical protein